MSKETTTTSPIIVEVFPSVRERIVRIQNEFRINKDGKNTFANYDYYKPDTILQKLNPLLEKYRLHTRFDLTNEGEYFRGVLVISDWDTDKGDVTYIFDILKASVKGANEAQNSGATLTYCKRYSLMNAFNIADNDVDFDSNNMTSKFIKGHAASPSVEPKPKPKTKVEITNKPEAYVSVDSMKVLWKEAKDKKVTADQWSDILKQMGIQTSAEVTNEQYDAIKEIIDNYTP